MTWLLIYTTLSFLSSLLFALNWVHFVFSIEISKPNSFSHASRAWIYLTIPSKEFEINAASSMYKRIGIPVLLMRGPNSNGFNLDYSSVIKRLKSMGDELAPYLIPYSILTSSEVTPLISNLVDLFAYISYMNYSKSSGMSLFLSRLTIYSLLILSNALVRSMNTMNTSSPSYYIFQWVVW